MIKKINLEEIKSKLEMIVVDFDRGNPLTLPFDLGDSNDNEIICYWRREQPNQYRRARKLYNNKRLIERAREQICGWYSFE